jgi:pyruvate kinase
MYDRYPKLETRTKIVATLGPASWDEPVLRELLLAGVDVCRINCSHADHDGIRRLVSRVRHVAHEIDKHVAILLDLQGPKIRTGKVHEPLNLQAKDTLTVVMSKEFVAEGHQPLTVGTTYPQMADDVSAGDEVLFSDGAIAGVVSEVRRGVDPAEVDIVIRNGGRLGSHKGINLPGVQMSVPPFTKKDVDDLGVGCLAGVDYVALSFVRSKDDVTALRKVLQRLGQPAMPIIAKIEKPQAIDNLDGILDVSQGVMVARGDLGVEVHIEAVPVYQKDIIEAARMRGRLCITATQMLDSMERNPRPTRAETTDVANAIIDGTDAVMLSGETAVGKYPVEAVRTMDRICRLAEDSRYFHPTRLEDLPHIDGPIADIVSAACYAVAQRPRPLVTFTWTGRTAYLLSKTRPAAPIYAITPSHEVADRLSLAWGVTPVVGEDTIEILELIAQGMELLIARGHLQRGQETVTLAGTTGLEGVTNTLRIHYAGTDKDLSIKSLDRPSI